MVSAYFVLADLKSKINITDNADDTILTIYTTESNAEADSELTPIVATVPITTPTQTQKDFALTIGMMKWYEYIKMWSAYNKAKVSHDDLKEKIRGEEKANYTTRHTLKYGVSDYRTEPLKTNDSVGI